MGQTPACTGRRSRDPQLQASSASSSTTSRVCGALRSGAPREDRVHLKNLATRGVANDGLDRPDPEATRGQIANRLSQQHLPLVELYQRKLSLDHLDSIERSLGAAQHGNLVSLGVDLQPDKVSRPD